MEILVQKIPSLLRYFHIFAPDLVRKSSSWIVHSLRNNTKREQQEYTLAHCTNNCMYLLLSVHSMVLITVRVKLYNLHHSNT